MTPPQLGERMKSRKIETAGYLFKRKEIMLYLVDIGLRYQVLTNGGRKSKESCVFSYYILNLESWEKFKYVLTSELAIIWRNANILSMAYIAEVP